MPVCYGFLVGLAWYEVCCLGFGRLWFVGLDFGVCGILYLLRFCDLVFLGGCLYLCYVS